MKAFHTIAVPHKDILEGRMTMDIFAADLWEVSQNRGPDEYRDKDTFFRKTFITQGLENLLSIVEKRLHGEGGDPVIEIQTPFGGGKTHALIAMYHKAEEWQARKIVLSGTALSAEETLWGVIEKKLTGTVTKFAGYVSPGKETLRELLSNYQPLVILMDEVLVYATKAAGVKVGESTLAAQTIAFMHELTETIAVLDKTSILITLPSSILEHYDESAEKLFQQLQKVVGRVEKIYTPVLENEITKIIRRRLFSDFKEAEAKRNVAEFMEYSENEGILPQGIQPGEYRERFLNSYPFLPEVIDVLYHRWGSFPTFQRTRGVLRLLSLVVHSLKELNKPYISPADFDLKGQEIRQELLKYIGPEYDSVIAADITSTEAGAKKVDQSLGNAYNGLKLGSRTSTTIFLYSFSGGIERGLTTTELKRCGTTTVNPSSVIAEALDQLKGRLFYLQTSGERYFFTNQPNLNRILLTNMENVPVNELVENEKQLLKQAIKGGKFKTFVWEENNLNIPDSEELKLLILKKENRELIINILNNKGQTPRVNRNTILFVFPCESEKPNFLNLMKKKIGYEYIEKDKVLKITEDQKKEIKIELKKIESVLKESIRKLYRNIAVPHRDGFRELDMGIPTYGEEKSLDLEVYEKLHSCGEILEKIAPIVLKEKYLKDKKYVITEKLYQALLTTPGETRLLKRYILESGISEGVQMGIFGLGELKDDKPACIYFKENAPVAFCGSEIMIEKSVCIDQLEKKKSHAEESPDYRKIKLDIPVMTDSQSRTEKIEAPKPLTHEKKELCLRFQLPKGKVSGLMGLMNLLQNKFAALNIELFASEGYLSDQDYEKIKETFFQLGIQYEENENL